MQRGAEGVEGAEGAEGAESAESAGDCEAADLPSLSRRLQFWTSRHRSSVARSKVASGAKAGVASSRRRHSAPRAAAPLIRRP